jgi:hypothetical protein
LQAQRFRPAAPPLLSLLQLRNAHRDLNAATVNVARLLLLKSKSHSARPRSMRRATTTARTVRAV